MNGVVKTLILLVVFVFSAIIGFVLPIQGTIASIEEKLLLNKIKTSPQIVAIEQPQITKVDTITVQKEDSLAIVASQTEIEPINEVNLKVSSVSLYKLRKNDKTDKLYYTCDVKASYPEGTKVKYCAYYNQNGEERCRTFFSSKSQLPPVDGGKYEFTIKDVDTGLESPRFAKQGFDKIRKMSRERLESILNNKTPLPNDFYHYVVKAVKIHTQSIFEGEGNVKPETCEFIMSSTKYSSWNVDVIGEPRYNEDNRITEFTVVITQN